MCSNDYVVIKINGNDIRKMPRCEAVQMFLQTKDNIVVELTRRKPDFDDAILRTNISQEQICDKVGDLQISKINNNKLVIESDSSPKPNAITPIDLDNELVLTLRPSFSEKELNIASKETQTDSTFTSIKDTSQRDLTERFIEEEHTLFEQCLEPEINLEEVTLSVNEKQIYACSDENLGITVCFSGNYVNDGIDNNSYGTSKNNTNSNSNDAIAITSEPTNLKDNFSGASESYEVFIRNIQPNSIAARDGRLRRGDQILQINGKTIKNEQDAKILFSKHKTVTLLVSRYIYPEYDDDDDDEDEEEYYVDNTLEYVNGFLETTNYTNTVNKIDKELELVEHSDKADSQAEVNDKIATGSISCAVAAPLLTSVNVTNKESYLLNDLIIKSKVEQHGTQQKDLQVEQMITNKSNMQIKSVPKAVLTKMKYEYDDTEHIYETIPEDPDSEPFYCSPYQSSTYMTAAGSCSSTATNEVELQQKQRVAQWLGMKSLPFLATPNAAPTASLPTHRNAVHKQANKVNTVRSILTNTSGSSSSGAGCNAYIPVSIPAINPIDEIDNSSSAYNTGGSNNSASPLTLKLNSKHQISDQKTNETVTSNPKLTLSNMSTRLRTQKEFTIISPRNNGLALGKTAVHDVMSRNRLHAEDQQQSAHKSLFKKDANAAQQHFWQNQQTVRQHEQLSQLCPQFNAPNLSQYHFVSSQEVASATKTLNSPFSPNKASSIVLATEEKCPKETQMVWKVKRRQDGTRYIVRRPMRSRLPAEIRKNVRGNDINTTTEDDTISEVKIGRYWTKEERKRHIERARERRQHQQQFLLQQNEL